MVFNSPLTQSVFKEHSTNLLTSGFSVSACKPQVKSFCDLHCQKKTKSIIIGLLNNHFDFDKNFKVYKWNKVKDLVKKLNLIQRPSYLQIRRYRYPIPITS